MKKVITYIKKNVMFVFLLVSLLLIGIGLSAYYFLNQPKKPLEEEQNEQVEEPKEETKITGVEISTFEGYLSKDHAVVFHWDYEGDTSIVTSAGLYYEGNKLADVKGYRQYSLMQSTYQFKGGNNVFELRLETTEGPVVKETTVSIDYISSHKVNLVENENGYDIQLIYTVDAGVTLKTPRILLNNAGKQKYGISYKDQTIQNEDGKQVVTVTFQLDTSQVEVGTYTLDVRWVFDDINKIFDDKITIEKKAKTEVEEPTDQETNENEETLPEEETDTNVSQKENT